MKPVATTSYRSTACHGFTLVELVTAMGVFGLLTVGVIQVHIMGMRMDQLARSKLGASEESRAAIGKMITEIRSAGVVRVGNGGLTNFQEIAHGDPQAANALQIQPLKSDPNVFVRYYWDGADQKLKRTEDGTTEALIVANSIRNTLVFTAEDAFGRVLTNNQNNRVIGVELEFYQLQYPNVKIGPGSLYDFYQLRTKITRRALE